jgi:hypothetical protein
MNIFDIHTDTLNRYGRYVSSFITIADPQIESFIQRELYEERSLWPDPLVQLNPAYERVSTVDALSATGQLHPDVAEIFRTGSGQSFHLYRHQVEALTHAADKQPYVVTSGTGSGKSLTYFLPIFDEILRGNPAEKKVFAIVVYPMNALVNSQELSLQALADQYKLRTGREMPVRFAQYTGQTNRQRKQELRANPPHILLTNYVMLEMMLVRPQENPFVDRATTALQFLVMDELHTYRGRQGADVALLVRRLKERSGNPNLLCIGTSATMASEGGRAERLGKVAEFATRFFGVAVAPERIVEETLERTIPASDNLSAASLQQALAAPLPDARWDIFATNPLSAWIEETLGVRQEEGLLRRQPPRTLQQAARQLADLTGVDVEHCAGRLREMLELGSRIYRDGENTAIAFKLHQFISQGNSVYATAEAPQERHLTLEGQYYAPGGRNRLLYPLAFCRQCGQEYYAARWDQNEQMLLPDAPIPSYSPTSEEENDSGVTGGYWMMDRQGAWQDRDDDLPAHWFERSGRFKTEYRKYRPLALNVVSDGSLADQPHQHALPGWFQPRPFMLCLSCGEAYTQRDVNDFRKLSRLSSEGRSTATSLLNLFTVASMRQTDLDPTAQKILSFTDNRQDASLQAGHFNDFVQVAMLRSALCRALEEYGELRHDNVAGRVMALMGLDLQEYARLGQGQVELEAESEQGRRARAAFQELLEYRLYEDLRRGWRVVQPNLEQSGLLRVEYAGMEDLAGRDERWAAIPFMARRSPTERRKMLLIILDEMRRRLAIDAPPLHEERQQEMKRRVNEYVAEEWAFDDEDERNLQTAVLYVFPGEESSRGDYSLSQRSTLGQWLKQTVQSTEGNWLNETDFNALITGIINQMTGFGLLIEQEEGRGNQRRRGVRIRGSALVWKPGNGRHENTPLRRRQAQGEAYRETEDRVNAFFSAFYPTALDALRRMKSGAHTAQIPQELREKREGDFRAGALSTLFCSPTMELGVDIRDLNAVHLRNVPPTPANYAQRSGRAGRAGQPALITTYCSIGSGHDQYFFRNRSRMVAGAVVAPRLDLGNEDLIRAHIHAIWLAHTGIYLGDSISDIVNVDAPDYPLWDEIAQAIHISPTRQQACVDACQQVLESCGADLQQAEWYDGNWLANQIQQSAQTFDRAFDRWRELFRLADAQLAEAHQRQRRSYRGRRSNPDSETEVSPDILIREAQRQLDLLTCTNTSHDESDFYPYRYLASESFLPGYNFPSLPVRAYVNRGSSGDFISRPRFLALNEFGPDNRIYHEGRQHLVKKVMLPLQDSQDRFTRAKACYRCGYIHTGNELHTELCVGCQIRLDGSNSQMLVNLLVMPTVNTLRAARITCDEEERMRQGYDITTHFRYARTQDGRFRKRMARTQNDGETELLELDYAPAADLWRINHGWRRTRERGYALDLNSGRWLSRDAASGDANARANVRHDVRLFVQQTANALLIHLPSDEIRDESFLSSLQYALARGIQEEFQVEEGELAVELIGQEERRGILLWESTEGGLGVLRRLVEESDALPRVARRALEILHFDPSDGSDQRPPEDEVNGCAQACYECLLSYFNQREHRLLNRHTVRDFLMALAGGVTRAGDSERSYDELYAWLRARTDTRSALERTFLDALYRSGRRLPDRAQHSLPELYTIPDFFYEPDICVYCDGSVHDDPQQRATDERLRSDLRARGYRVVVIRYDEDLESKVAGSPDIFGVANV